MVKGRAPSRDLFAITECFECDLKDLVLSDFYEELSCAGKVDVISAVAFHLLTVIKLLDEVYIHVHFGNNTNVKNTKKQVGKIKFKFRNFRKIVFHQF